MVIVVSCLSARQVLHTSLVASKPNTLANAQRVARVPNQPSDLRARFIVTAGPTQSISACAEPRAMTIETLRKRIMLAVPAGVRPRGLGHQHRAQRHGQTPRREPRPRRGTAARTPLADRGVSDRSRFFAIAPRRSRVRTSTSGHALPLPDDEARDATACCLRAPIRVRVTPSPI